ncbi:3-phosphoshikimate 1-carboxyvinyltransferase [Tepidimicrobium xylanilyticum]|uniref:3-phosphoshikimate 1-carboxyvinyltransferase n=1 Tax=Tepidimicrobium xylanilyticum TaxID=1123352 RepID=A0A1H2SU88_9FIRM|nr:3-phosphoshikimate 1-carboxyvinyltransferase [Tepidimicrobium xylanilyticum]SDW34604.1 3-phosphoshikimate 1-carboxyvinyltransferase [Tepidimicrobium xylanilyticum]
MIIKGNSKKFVGEIRVPGDKSISHRSIMIGSIANGHSTIEGILMSEDVIRTIEAFKSMGVNIRKDDEKIYVEGVGLKGLKKPISEIYCGNSGTTMRLLAGILVGQDFSSTLTGDESLSKRPMYRIINPLKQMNGNIKGRKDKFPPLMIEPSMNRLKGIDYRLPMASAQVKSAILLATLYVKGSTRIREDKISRDHTERMLNYFGCKIVNNNGLIYMDSNNILTGKDITIPGDISSAAYFIVAATLIKNSNIIIRGVGLNPTRVGIINVLKKMGANIRILNEDIVNNEPFGDIQITESKLRGILIDEDVIGTLIDEIPIITVAACFAEGRTVIKGAEELKYKESNRLMTISRELKKMGAKIQLLSDGLIIDGVKELKGASLDSYNDHRIAMALSIAALLAQGESKINNYECVNISYPDFYNTLFNL